MNSDRLEIGLEILPYSQASTEIQSVRRAVFQIEQKVETILDFDGLDATAQHIVVFDQEKPIGTARIRYLSKDLAKIERVAVLSAYRNRGVGRYIMQAAITFLEQQNISEVKVHAQCSAAPFYEKLGFQAHGEAFYEANILHIEMRRICLRAEKN